jgi:hypothetical protein
MSIFENELGRFLRGRGRGRVGISSLGGLRPANVLHGRNVGVGTRSTAVEDRRATLVVRVIIFLGIVFRVACVN